MAKRASKAKVPEPKPVRLSQSPTADPSNGASVPRRPAADRVFSPDCLEALCAAIQLDAVRPIVEGFLKELPDRLTRLRSFGQSGSFDELGSAAHSLKGVCQTLGLEGLASLCTDLELSLEDTKAEKLQAILAEFPARVEAATLALHTWLNDREAIERGRR